MVLELVRARSAELGLVSFLRRSPIHATPSSEMAVFFGFTDSRGQRTGMTDNFSSEGPTAGATQNRITGNRGTAVQMRDLNGGSIHIYSSVTIVNGSPSTGHASPRTLQVLAVDDDPHSLNLLVEGLQHNPDIGKVLRAVDAAEALRLLASDDPELRRRKEIGLPMIDAVFADLQMPGLSGMEMARVFSALNPAPAVVFVTGHTHQAVNAFDLDAVDYLLKPCDQSRLDRAVDRVLAKLRAAPIPAHAT